MHLSIETNEEFGHEGLEALVQGMMEWDQEVCDLEIVYLRDVGLGDHTTEATLDLLTQFLSMTPKLLELDFGNNYLTDLSPSFIDAVVSHRALEIIDFSNHQRLAHHSLHLDPSGPCTIQRFLSQLLIAASSSSLTLRQLDLGRLILATDCCIPALHEIVSLGPEGLAYLTVGFEMPTLGPNDLPFVAFLNPHFQPFSLIGPIVQIISDENRYIRELMHYPYGEGEDYDTLKAKLERLLERNKRLHSETHTAALEVLKVARTILHATPVVPSPAASPVSSSSPPSPFLPSISAKPSDRVRLLDVPSELLPTILSFLSPGALLERQIRSVIQHAADRKNFVLKTIEQRDLPREHFIRVAYMQKRAVLDGVGCFKYDFEV